MTARRAFRHLTWYATRYKGWPNSLLSQFALLMRDSYRDYSFDLKTNGESWLLATLARTSRIDTVFDVGSHAGDWARLALQYFPHASIHCFEPSGDTFKVLANALANTACILNNAGLGATTGVIDFKEFTAEGCSTGSTFVEEFSQFDTHAAPRVGKAHVVRGDEYCREKGVDSIDLLKVDVEGFEPEVLRGLSPLLEDQKVGCVQFEYGYHNSDTHFLMKDFYAFFAKHRYRIGRLWSSGVHFMDFDYRLNNFTSGPNFVAIPLGNEHLFRALNHPLASHKVL